MAYGEYSEAGGREMLVCDVKAMRIGVLRDDGDRTPCLHGEGHCVFQAINLPAY